MQRKITFVTFLVILAGCFSLSAEDSIIWTRKADLPTARSGFAAVVLNNKIYAIGGSNYNTVYSSVEIYDPTTDNWTAEKNMNEAKTCSAAVVDNKIYVIGGTQVEEYDPMTGIWQIKASVPAGMNFSGAEVINNKIYSIGGSSQVYEYDPIMNNWTVKTAIMPNSTNRDAFEVKAVNNKLYVIGGRFRYNSSGSYVSTSDVEEYDPILDTWIKRANMNTPRSSFGAAVVNSKIYAIVGYSDSGGILTGHISYIYSVEEYEPATNTWELIKNTSFSIIDCESVVVNNRIYLIGNRIVEEGLIYDSANPPTSTSASQGIDTVRPAEIHLGRASAVKKKIQELKEKN